METIINKKIEKRLKWLDSKNSDLIVRVAKYISDNPFYFANNNQGYSSGNNNNTLQDTVNIFINNARHYEDDAYLREYCRNMKAAWLSWDKRNKNEKNPTFHESSYSISIRARGELERLAKGRTKKSLSSVIDTLLLDALSIKALQKQLSKIVNETNYNIRLNSDFFSTFFSDDKVNDQAIIITQMLKQNLGLKESELKNEKIKSTKLENENSKLNTEMDRMREKTVSLEEENSKLKKSEQAR
ncbi:MAG: hypothetical protein COA59_00225 [Colwellia sp.]|nr:MAG: hypothetical protein COA59_00225 [Colwellia sp.]